MFGQSKNCYRASKNFGALSKNFGAKNYCACMCARVGACGCVGAYVGALPILLTLAK